MKCINLSDNKVIAMNETTGDIILNIEDLEDYVGVDEHMCIHFEEDPQNITHEYKVVRIDEYNNVIALKWIKQLEESLLTEAPVVKLDDADLVEPNEINFKDKIKQGLEQERIDAENKAKEEKAAELRARYANVITDMKKASNTMDALEILFDALVPNQGPAETVAGELVRAVMRILYRDYNDGDKFFTGYGLESCGGSAQYLYDNGFDTQIEEILDRKFQLADDDEKYTAAITDLAQDIIVTIEEDPTLLETVNEKDSRGYNYTYIKEQQPRYEYEIPGSDNINTLVEKHVLSSWDLTNYVEDLLSYESVYEGSNVARPWSHYDTSVTVEELTKEGVEYLEETVRRNLDGFWEDLVSEHADELESDEDEDDEDDE